LTTFELQALYGKACTHTVLYESADDLRYAYFPINYIVSKFYVMENGASAEIAVIGDNGIVGVALFMGGISTTTRTLVQSIDYAYLMNVDLLTIVRAG
jgi:hypothetical protein